MGRLDEALKLFFRNPIPSDPSFYLRLLDLCIEARANKHGRLIHTYLFYNGFDSNLTLNTKMIIFYSKVGDMGNAHKVFDKMPERNIVSWTALLSGYSQNGFFKDALMVFQNMHHSGLKGNQFTYGSALRACTKLMCIRSGKQIQGCLQKSRFVGNVFVQSALVDLHSKCGDIVDASCVFKMMHERDLVCWNAMIGGYSVQGFANYAFGIFKSMLRQGVVPDCFTFGSLLSACAQGIHISEVSQLHGTIVQYGFGSHNMLNRQMISVYTKCGSMRRAYTVFKSMVVKDVLSYTAMIAAYAHDGDHYIEAFNLFSELYQSGATLDDFLLCTMLNVCADSSSLIVGRQIHALALKCLPAYDVAMGNSLIDMYAKCGELEEANYIFDQMQEKNVISWSSLINGCAKHGYVNKALVLYRMMVNEGHKPNYVTFLSLLFACSHAGLTKEGWECFHNMTDKYNIAPTEKHYSCMVDLFARGGHLEEALDLMQKMNIPLTASLWGAIFSASNVYGDMSLGKVAAKRLLDLDGENSAHYVALASAYAAAGCWDDSQVIHEQMELKNLKKSPGLSLVLSSDKTIEVLQG